MGAGLHRRHLRLPLRRLGPLAGPQLVLTLRSWARQPPLLATRPAASLTFILIGEGCRMRRILLIAATAVVAVTGGAAHASTYPVQTVIADPSGDANVVGGVAGLDVQSD